ncbi:MAG: hypothetical protein JNN15_04125 [Blastocatellia bacterium]|nr:hypothetical protein [Blastocatellia bacterium]
MRKVSGLLLLLLQLVAVISCVNTKIDSSEKKALNQEEEVKKPIFSLGLKTDPKTIAPADQVRLFLEIKKNDGTVVDNFEVVHEKLMHLFVVSSDMEQFFHLHPEKQAGGTFIETASFPEGRYKAWAGVRPKGEGDLNLSATFDVGHPFVRPNRLIADTIYIKEIDDTRVTLRLPSKEMKAGEAIMLNYVLTDPSTRRSIKDLEPFLGEMGHLMIISEDGNEFVHSHPMSSSEAEFGVVSFHVEFPRAGRYKAWAQFNKGGKILTTSFVLQVG